MVIEVMGNTLQRSVTGELWSKTHSQGTPNLYKQRMMSNASCIADGACTYSAISAAMLEAKYAKQKCQRPESAMTASANCQMPEAQKYGESHPEGSMVHDAGPVLVYPLHLAAMLLEAVKPHCCVTAIISACMHNLIMHVACDV